MNDVWDGPAKCIASVILSELRQQIVSKGDEGTGKTIRL